MFEIFRCLPPSLTIPLDSRREAAYSDSHVMHVRCRITHDDDDEDADEDEDEDDGREKRTIDPRSRGRCLHAKETLA